LMAVVFPSKAIARRWDGALQARLRRRPLEKFLRTRGLAPTAPPASAQDDDSLALATVFMIQQGLDQYLATEELAESHYAIVGRFACVISRSLAARIGEQSSWRIMALVSAARLLNPWIGLTEAALASTASIRHFQQQLLQGACALDLKLGQSAAFVLDQDSAESLSALTTTIVERLNLSGAGQSGPHSQGVAIISH
jgi:hypothetical protein